MDWIELGGHYGRDYANQTDVRKDWDANKDFRVNEGGRYGAATNREDLEAMKERGEISGVTIRYGKGLKVMDMKL